eukprot:scaffold417156_cov22-Prasinocladus_malaysianus.AAC.1
MFNQSIVKKNQRIPTSKVFALHSAGSVGNMNHFDFDVVMRQIAKRAIGNRQCGQKGQCGQ